MYIKHKQIQNRCNYTLKVIYDTTEDSLKTDDLVQSKRLMHQNRTITALKLRLAHFQLFNLTDQWSHSAKCVF